MAKKLYPEAYNLSKAKIVNIFDSAYEAEQIWADYIFDDFNGELKSITRESMDIFIKSNFAMVTRAIGVESSYIDTDAKNPYRWIKKYTDIGSVQTALNETSGTAYLFNAIDTSISEDEWKNL